MASDDRPSPPLFDEAEALAHTGGDRGLLQEIVGLVRADAPAALRAIGRAIDAGDGEALRRAGHTLKGSLASVGAMRPAALAAALEQCGRAGAFDSARESYDRLGRDLAELDRIFDTAGLAAAAMPASRRAPRRNRRTR
jgi:HPt (histidine-containing phosphotransfer) domain-containing protein